MPYQIKRLHRCGHEDVSPKYYFVREDCERIAKASSLVPCYSSKCIDACFCDLARKRLLRDFKAFRWIRLKGVFPFVFLPISLCYGVKTMIEDFRYELGQR